MSTTLSVIVYGNGDLFREYFNAIVTAFGKGNGGGQFKTLLQMSILLAGFTVVYSFILKRDLMVMVRWLGIFYVAMYVLFLPEATIIITDRVNQDKMYAVDHVPLGLAIIASYTSQIGDALTQNIESNFTMPDYQPYHRTGMVFSSRLVEAASQFEITDAKFDQNLKEFIHQCVFYDLLLEKYSVNTLMESPNVWTQITSNASPARAFIYNGQVTTCRVGAGKLTEDWKAVYEHVAARYGKRIYPALLREDAKAKLLTDLPISYQYLTKLSQNANELLQQNLMSNAIQRGIISMGAQLNAPAALESYAFARAQEQKRLTNKTLGDMAAHWLPLMKNAFEAIMYGSFVFIVLLSVFPFGGMIVKNYVFTLLWIQIWAPLYAIINLIVSYYAQVNSTAAVDGGLSLQAMSGILQINSDISGLAGYLTLSVPFLSAGLVKGMASTFTQISQYVGGVTQSAGGTAASEAVTGNMSFGNTSFGNQSMFNNSANHSDTSGRVNSGSFSTALPGGSSATVTSDGSVVMDMKNSISSLGASVNFADSLRTSYAQQAERSDSAALNSAMSLSSATTSLLKDNHELSKHIGKSDSSGQGWNVSTSSGVSHAVSQVESMVQDFATRNNIGYNEAASLLSSAYVSGQLGVSADSKGSLWGKALSAGTGISGSISASGGMSRSAGHTNATDRSALFSEAQSYIKNNNFSESVDTIERAVKDHSFRTNSEEGSRLVGNMGASLDQAESFRSDMNSNLSHAESARVNASIAQEKSALVNANASQGFKEWISNQPGTNGTGKMGLKQVESVLKDPNMQMYYANQYVEQYKSQFENNWSHGMAHTKGQIENQFQSSNKSVSAQSSISANYETNKGKVQHTATNQGLVPESISPSARSDAENMVIENSNKLSTRQNEIKSESAVEKNKITNEKSNVRHGGLLGDLWNGVDTKDHT